MTATKTTTTPNGKFTIGQQVGIVEPGHFPNSARRIIGTATVAKITKNGRMLVRISEDRAYEFEQDGWERRTKFSRVIGMLVIDLAAFEECRAAKQAADDLNKTMNEVSNIVAGMRTYGNWYVSAAKRAELIALLMNATPNCE